MAAGPGVPGARAPVPVTSGRKARTPKMRSPPPNPPSPPPRRRGGRGPDLEDALRSRKRALDRLPLVAESGYGLEEALKEEGEGGQGPQRDAERGEGVARAGPEEEGDG